MLAHYQPVDARRDFVRRIAALAAAASLLSIAFLGLQTPAASAADTADAAHTSSQRFFRSNQGVAAEDQRPLPDDLAREGVRRWRVPLGSGHSTPCVVGDALYVTTFEDGKLATVALDRATGREKWRQVAPATRLEAFHPTGSPAAASVFFPNRTTVRGPR